MKKKFSFYASILSLILFMFLSISGLITIFIEEYIISFLLISVSLLALYNSIFCFKEYKYFSGNLNFKQFRKHYNYEYYYMIYGSKAYTYYLKRYK
jgi:hypothetical protein